MYIYIYIYIYRSIKHAHWWLRTNLRVSSILTIIIIIIIKIIYPRHCVTATRHLQRANKTANVCACAFPPKENIYDDNCVYVISANE